MRPSFKRELASRLRYLGVGSYVMYEIIRELMTDEDLAFIREIIGRSNSLGFDPEHHSYSWSDKDLP